MCFVTETAPADDLQPQPGQTARVSPAMLVARRRKETPESPRRRFLHYSDSLFHNLSC